MREPAFDNLVALARAGAQAGVGLIQIREPDLEARALFDLTLRILEATAETAAAVVVNERVDLAIAAGAHGVHLRADSAGARRVRAIAASGFLIGQSVHSPREAAAAEEAGVDYMVMGTVYPSRSKPGVAALAGLAGLGEVCRAVHVPVLAIGGVTADRAGEVARAGAAGVAAIGLFTDVFSAAGGRDAGVRLAQMVQAMTGTFTAP